MNINEFSLKHKLSNRDQAVVSKVYAGLDKIEKDWVSELKDKVKFNFEKAEKLIKVKAIKNKKDKSANSEENNKSTDSDKSKKNKNIKK